MIGAVGIEQVERLPFLIQGIASLQETGASDERGILVAGIQQPPMTHLFLCPQIEGHEVGCLLCVTPLRLWVVIDQVGSLFTCIHLSGDGNNLGILQ